jgi:hypothetical protein
MNENTEYQRVMQLVKILDFDNLRKFVLAVDIPYSTLANGENKNGFVSSRVLAAIKKAFPKVSLDWLVLGEGLPFLPSASAAPQNIVNGNGNFAHQVITAADCADQLHQKDIEIIGLNAQVKLLKDLLNSK